jgi:hypothetical protein
MSVSEARNGEMRDIKERKNNYKSGEVEVKE